MSMIPWKRILAAPAWLGLGVGLLTQAPAGAADMFVAPAPALPTDGELEAAGAKIGSIVVRAEPIFNTADEREDKLLFRLANRLHLETRESAIRAQLLFAPGQPYSRGLLAETERNLRELRFIREPEIRPVRFHDGVVDIEVITHDVWTMSPGLSFGRAGGANSTGVEIEDLNVLGFGKQLTVDYGTDVDRTSYTIGWYDPNIWGTRWRSELAFTSSDDGDGTLIRVERPFFSLDTRRSSGISLEQHEGIDRHYALGEAVDGYRRRQSTLDVRYGWSAGLHDGWTHRWTTGVRYDTAAFELEPGEPVPARLPEDRRLVYPYVRFDAIENDFATAYNHDQMARTEDVHFGTHYALALGWSSPAFGADRSAAVLEAQFGRGLRLAEQQSLFLSADMAGRMEGAALADTLVSADARYYWHTSPRTALFASLEGEVGRALDADHDVLLGGTSGLRGYPLRYQSGSARALLTLEERFYTNWSVWRIARIGAAVFMDAGRTWGDSAAGAENLGVLKDIGFGLRLGNTRSALANVLHLDVAFPLDGDSSISNVQFLVETKHSF